MTLWDPGPDNKKGPPPWVLLVYKKIQGFRPDVKDPMVLGIRGYGPHVVLAQYEKGNNKAFGFGAPLTLGPLGLGPVGLCSNLSMLGYWVSRPDPPSPSISRPGQGLSLWGRCGWCVCVCVLYSLQSLS